MPEHLLLILDAPLCAFGGEIIDNRGVIRPFPGSSNLVGLIGNALGLDRAEGARLDALQARLVAGSLRLREGVVLRDFQTAQLAKADMGWTTRGRREGREGGAGTYQAPHIRLREWEADAAFLVALRLEPAAEEPTLSAVEAALMQPERPLFLGRKPALPSWPITAGRLEAVDVATALRLGLSCARVASWRERRKPREAYMGKEETGEPPRYRAAWPVGEGEGGHISEIADERRWAAGVHGGLRRVIIGELTAMATP